MKKRLLGLCLFTTYLVAQDAQAKGMLDDLMPDILEVIKSAAAAGMSDLTPEQVATVEKVLTGDIIKGDVNQALQMIEKNKDVQPFRKQVQDAIETAGKTLFKSQKTVFDAVRNLECVLHTDGINAALKAYAQHMKDPDVQNYFELIQERLEKIKDNVTQGLFDHLQGLDQINQEIMQLLQKNRQVKQIEHYINTVKEQLERSILGNPKDQRRKAILDATALERNAIDMAIKGVADAAKTVSQKKYLSLLSLKVSISKLAEDVAMAGTSMGSMAQQAQNMMEQAKTMGKVTIRKGKNTAKDVIRAGKRIIQNSKTVMGMQPKTDEVMLGTDAASRHMMTSDSTQ